VFSPLGVLGEPVAVQLISDRTGGGESISRQLRTEADVTAAGAGKKQDFGELVKEFAADVNDLQFQSADAVNRFVTGEATDVHQVMVAVQQAGIAMDLMLEIRNRTLEGYQELIRMQV
jgi:flagellar hook-basal body complex protein FliE